MSAIISPSYRSGFYSPDRGGVARYPSLWRGCIGAWHAGLGATGLIVRDQSRYSRHGILGSMSPATDWVLVDGVPAIELSGGTEQISIPPVELGSQGSMAAWLRYTDIANSGFFRAAKSGANYFDFGFIYAGSVYCGWYQPADDDRMSPTVSAIDLTLNRWCHLAITWTNDTQRLYFNGRQVATNSVTALWTGVTSMYVSGYTPFYGQLGEFSIYKRELSIGDIRLLASRPGIAYELRRDVVRGTPSTIVANLTINAFLAKSVSNIS